MNYKSKTVPVKISRVELCDMLIATTAIARAFKAEGGYSRKWEILHDKLKEQLDAIDAKNGTED